MTKTILAIIFGILLLISLICLIIWTIQASRERISKKRSRRSVAAKQKHSDDLFETDAASSMGYWYNKEDMADADDIMKLRYQHHFNKLEDCIHDLIVEMYDCGLVRTEELYTIAYGQDSLTPDSVIFRISEGSDDNADDDVSDISALAPVSDDAQRKIYEKWSGYVNSLLEIVEIQTSDDNKKAIIDGLMTYGRKNLLTLLYSPE